MAEKEKSELKILEEFLPPQLSESEVEAKVKMIIEKMKGGGELKQGLVMKEVMTELQGQADGTQVAKIVGRMLSQL